MKAILIFYIFFNILFFSVSGQNIELSNNSFIIENEKFTPIGVNFAMNFKTIAGEVYFNIASDQCRGSCGNSKYEINNNLINLITEIENKGFNTLRIAGFAMYMNDFDKYASFSVYKNKQLKAIKINDFTPYINAIESAISLIEKNSNLKVIIITGSHGVDDINIREYYSSYLKELNNALDKYNCVFAYDVYNEPPFFTVKYDYDKCEIAQMTSDWYNSLKGRHLVTIGLFGTLDIFQFDPAIVSVDFINFHIFPYMLKWNNYDYEIAKSITAKDYKWISRNVKKPWIIGETAFPGSNYYNYANLAIGTEEQQEDFAEYTINAINANTGLGVIWWQYSEVAWYNLDEVKPKLRNNFYGIRFSDINNVPEEFAFRWKKAANVIPRFNEIVSPNFNISDINYYNPKRFRYKGIKGRIVSDFGQSITDAKILVEFSYIDNNNNKIISSNETFTDIDGFFNVFAPSPNFNIEYIKATATGYKNIYKNNIFQTNEFFLLKLKKVPAKCTQNEATNNNNNLFTIFPIPTKKNINIINNENIKIFSVQLINSTGKTIFLKYYDKWTSIDLSNYTRGIYILKIKHSFGCYTKKIIIY